MPADNMPVTPIRNGILMRFLRCDLFQVELDDGIVIDAVMPEELFHSYDPNERLTRVNRPWVVVDMREPPAMPKIVEVHRSSFVGPGY